MKPIIEIKDIAKKYSISGEAQTPYLSLRDSLTDMFSFNKSSKEDFWALKGVTFDIQAGESIGIIGRNGAGKSTLLKILSKITPPTRGEIVLRGRVASLLEVGTGFHPELTGRENVFLNGSILGLKRSEIIKHFDSIVDFSGIEKFIDTPLKHYSSGMQLRLAFAVASHLEPEILVVDEVLAVGDMEFQKKCLGKMDEVSSSGRTVIFVSHNMGVMQQLCQRIALLNKGELLSLGKSEDIIRQYLSLNSANQVVERKKTESARQFISSFQLQYENGEIGVSFSNNEKIGVRVNCRINQNVSGALLGMALSDMLNRRVFYIEKPLDYKPGDYGFNVSIPAFFLTPGSYRIQFAIHVPNTEVIDFPDDTLDFEVVDSGDQYSKYSTADIGCVYLKADWSVQPL